MSSEPAPSDERAIAICAQGLTKTYHVYARPQDRLLQMLWRGHRRFYRDFHAVRDVDLTIYRGETVGVVGRNGSGKSTLLQMICGILAPTSGTLDVAGHVAPLLALGAGFNPEFTGRENVMLNAAILGLSDAEVRERLDSVIAFADIGDFFDQPTKSFSSGMHSRLAFAVAINADPDILVIDEVLAVGDEAFTRKCFARIQEIKESGSTILFVSHSAASVIELCDRAVLMEGGRRLLTSDPKTVVSRYHKLLYTPRDQTPRVLREIEDLERSGSGGTGGEASGEPRGAGKPLETSRGPEDLGHFDPNLRPESTVEYSRQGAVIGNIRILDRNGRPVNVLRAGELYTWAFDVDFLESACRVRFGMMLKLVTGFELGGQVSHHPGDGIDFVEAGTLARVRFPFRASLVPGTYFLNAGVLALRNDAESFLHRIVDAAMFRIDPESRTRVTGRVDLSAPKAEVQVALLPGDTRKNGRDA
ncbi:MAG: ABC transporter ATP-binding protein [Myxococcota bacterium]|nr:ABC transporter ATP-binding protein [Myxococcota bacterium]